MRKLQESTIFESFSIQQSKNHDDAILNTDDDVHDVHDFMTFPFCNLVILEKEIPQCCG